MICVRPLMAKAARLAPIGPIPRLGVKAAVLRLLAIGVMLTLGLAIFAGPTNSPSTFGQASSATVWARGEEGVWRSDDGGESWQLKRADPCSLGWGGSIGGMAVVSDELVYVTGCDWSVWRTSDGGATWQLESGAPEAYGAGDVEASPQDVVLVTSYSLPNVKRRDPSTGTWSVVLQAEEGEDFYTPSIRDNVAYVTASTRTPGRNRVYKSTDAGITWNLIVDQPVPDWDNWMPFDTLVGIDANTLYIADTYYGLWVLEGSALRGPYPFYPDPQGPDVTALSHRKEGGIYVGGLDPDDPSRWPVRGSMGGALFDLTSQASPQPLDGDYVYSVADGGAGAFLVDYDTWHLQPGQNLYRSTDGGATWVTVNPPGEDYVATVGTVPIPPSPPVFEPEHPVSAPDHPVPETDDPVNTASGDFKHVHTDLAIPGRGVPLEFTRYYHSGSGAARSLGYGWTHSYDMYLEFTGADVTVFYPQGHATRFVFSDGVYVTRPGVYDTLVKNPDDTYTLTTVNQIPYNFSSSGVLTSIVDRNNNTTTLTYTSGLLTSATDPGGRSLTFTYDPSNRIETVTDPLPAPDTRTVEFAYDANGDLEQVTDVKGGITTYAYSNHRMTSLTDANAHVAVQNTYDSGDQVAEQQNAVGGITCIYYGTEPEYTSAACPGVSPLPTTLQTIVVDPRGNKTTYTFDDSWRATDARDHLGGVIHYDYDANNNATCLTDQRGYKTAYSYDAKGNLTQIIDALNTDADCQLKADGVMWTFSYTPKNDPDLETDPLGRQTDYVYDTPGNLTRIIRKDEAEAVKALTCFERDDAGQLTGLVESTDLVVPPAPMDPCTGHKTKFEYDQYGNLTAVIDPRFSSQPTPPQTTFTYDLGGRMHTVTNELDEVTTYTYDDQNNLLTIEDNLDDTTTYTHDAKGNLKTITDANRQPVGPGETGAQCGTAGTGDGVDDDGNTVKDDGCPSTIYDYDNADRLIEVIDALGNITSYGYDDNGNRTSVTNARSKVTTYAYDALNRLQSVTDPLGRVTSYQYDDASNLIERTDARDLFTQYTYDALNRLKDIDYFEFEGGPLVGSVDYTYDDVSNRLTMVDSTGTTSYAYDALNRLTSVIFPDPKVVSYQYDNVGNRSRITYPDDKYVDYTYDEANRMETVTDWLGKTTTYTYDNAGKPTNVAYPVSGFSLAYAYDLAGRLTQITHNTAILPQVITYTLDAVGNRTNMQVGSQTPTTYQYDSLYRLESVSYPDGGSTTYTYDAVGNRLSMFRSGIGSTGYIYDDADQLTEVAEAAYTYDASGNLRTRGIETYDYDFENRLTRITFNSFDPYPDNPAEFGCNDFNGDGVITVGGDVLPYRGQIGKQVPPGDPLLDVNNDGWLTVGGDVLWFRGNIGETCPRKFGYSGDGLRVTSELGRFWTDYAWDVAAGLPVVLQETYREKTMLPQETRYIKTYVYGLDLISVYTDDLEQETTAQDYYFADGLGSTVILARDSESNEAAEWTYDAFGEVRTQSGTLSTDFLFTGEQFDVGSDLYYLRARYYDPAIGRFLTRDGFPGFAGDPRSQQPYVYVGNNPAKFTDPAGQCPWCVAVVTCGLIGPCRDFVEDEAADVVDWGKTTVDHPSSVLQQTLGTLMALTSSGDRSREGDVTFYENCWGTCSFLRLTEDFYAITLGHCVFAEGPIYPELKRHELTHVRQGDEYRLLWPLAYLWEMRHGYKCNRFEEEARAAAGQPLQCEAPKE